MWLRREAACSRALAAPCTSAGCTAGGAASPLQRRPHACCRRARDSGRDACEVGVSRCSCEPAARCSARLRGALPLADVGAAALAACTARKTGRQRWRQQPGLAFSRWMKGRKRLRCRPPSYSASGWRLEVATRVRPRSQSLRAGSGVRQQGLAGCFIKAAGRQAWGSRQVAARDYIDSCGCRGCEARAAGRGARLLLFSKPLLGPLFRDSERGSVDCGRVALAYMRAPRTHLPNRRCRIMASATSVTKNSSRHSTLVCTVQAGKRMEKKTLKNPRNCLEYSRGGRERRPCGRRARRGAAGGQPCIPGVISVVCGRSRRAMATSAGVLFVGRTAGGRPAQQCGGLVRRAGVGPAAWARAARKTAMVNALCQLPLASHLVCNLIRHVGQRVGLAGKMPAVRRQAGGRGASHCSPQRMQRPGREEVESRWRGFRRRSATAQQDALPRSGASGRLRHVPRKRDAAAVVHPCGMRRAQLAAKSAAAHPSAARSWPPPLPQRQPPPTSGAGAPPA